MERRYFVLLVRLLLLTCFCGCTNALSDQSASFYNITTHVLEQNYNQYCSIINRVRRSLECMSLCTSKNHSCQSGIFDSTNKTCWLYNGRVEVAVGGVNDQLMYFVKSAPIEESKTNTASTAAAPTSPAETTTTEPTTTTTKLISTTAVATITTSTVTTTSEEVTVDPAVCENLGCPYTCISNTCTSNNCCVCFEETGIAYPSVFTCLGSCPYCSVDYLDTKMITDPSPGWIQSPNYPNEYDAYSSFDWSIDWDAAYGFTTLQITFHRFAAGYCPSYPNQFAINACSYDFLLVNGVKFCGKITSGLPYIYSLNLSSSSVNFMFHSNDICHGSFVFYYELM